MYKNFHTKLHISACKSTYIYAGPTGKISIQNPNPKCLAFLKIYQQRYLAAGVYPSEAPSPPRFLFGVVKQFCRFGILSNTQRMTPEYALHITQSPPPCYTLYIMNRPVPEFIDPAFAKTSPTRSFSHWKRAFWACFLKTGSLNSGTVLIHTGKVEGR